MLTVKKLHDDLEHWIQIGIGDDIVNLPAQRPEYQHLLKAYPSNESNELLPDLALRDLESQLMQPWYRQRTFWVLLWLQIKSFKVMGK